MSDWLLLLAHAFSTGIAQMLIFKSQQMVSAIMSGLAMSFDVIFTLVGQYTLLYRIQPGYKNDLEKYGAAVVLVSVIVVPVWGIVVKKGFPNRQNYQQIEQGPSTSAE